MYTGLLHLHHWLPFVYLLLMLAVLVQNFLVWKGQKAFTSKLARQNKIALILTHVQATVGIVMLAMLISKGVFTDMGSVMGVSELRFKYIEHPLTMLIAAVLITVGNAKAKRANTDQEKGRQTLLWFGLGLLLIVIRLPWEAFLAGA